MHIFFGMKDRIIPALVDVFFFAGNLHFVRAEDIGHGIAGHVRQAIHGFLHLIPAPVGKYHNIADACRFLLLVVERVIPVHKEAGLQEHGREGDDEEKDRKDGFIFSDVGFD